MKDWILIGDQVLKDDRLAINRNICMNEKNEIFPYSYLSFKNGVMIIPVLKDGRLVLIDQYRHAIRKRVVEFTAGAREDGEKGIEAAARELEEETGYRAEKLELLCGMHTLPGICSEYLEVYVATGLIEGQSNCEPSEDINIVIMSLPEIEEAIKKDEITSSVTISAFYKYLLSIK